MRDEAHRGQAATTVGRGVGVWPYRRLGVRNRPQNCHRTPTRARFGRGSSRCSNVAGPKVEQASLPVQLSDGRSGPSSLAQQRRSLIAMCVAVHPCPAHAQASSVAKASDGAEAMSDKMAGRECLRCLGLAICIVLTAQKSVRN